MKGYLLDTNILNYFFRKESGVHEIISGLPYETPINISVITLGEMEFGHKVESPKNQLPIQIQYKHFTANYFPYPINITSSTAIHYGEIRANLFEKYIPKKEKKKLRPEQLVDPVTSQTLQIQENDIWIAAQALERNLILVSHDKGMKRIKELMPELQLEDWADA